MSIKDIIGTIIIIGVLGVGAYMAMSLNHQFDLELQANDTYLTKRQEHFKYCFNMCEPEKYIYTDLDEVESTYRECLNECI